MLRYKRVLFFCFILFLFFSLAEAATLRLNQTKIRLIILPGETKTGVIEVDNPSSEEVNVKAYLEDWKYSLNQDGTKEFFPPHTLPLSCSGWISFSPSEFSIPPFGRRSIEYTVNVPKEAKGGHYAVLFFESLLGKSDLKENVGINVIVRIGALFYIEPEGTTIRKAEIENLSIEKEERDKTKITLDFKNSGNVDITTKGTFHIIDREGIIHARGDFNDVYTLPQDSARLVAIWKGSIPEGRYDLVITLDLGKDLKELGIGAPVITREAEIEIGKNGEVLRIGKLK
ncbi:MAG: hypothetical protein NC898_04570 [Candidatus Omnitrophica bacterium]|nr:hypothetical protein [Candidatus Omnitrophota bacterium]